MTPCALIEAANACNASSCMSVLGWYLPRWIRSMGMLRRSPSLSLRMAFDAGASTAASLTGFFPAPPNRASRPLPSFLLAVILSSALYKSLSLALLQSLSGVRMGVLPVHCAGSSPLPAPSTQSRLWTVYRTATRASRNWGLRPGECCVAPLSGTPCRQSV